MSSADACPEHPQPTRSVRRYRYCFSAKHHRGPRGAAQWATDLDHDAEFAIFDHADWFELTDDDGNLYGIRRDENGELVDLGTEGEQIAKFWDPAEFTPTHGFPLWPLGFMVSRYVKKKPPAPIVALRKMVDAGVLSRRDFRRLRRAKP